MKIDDGDIYNLLHMVSILENALKDHSLPTDFRVQSCELTIKKIESLKLKLQKGIVL